MGLRTIVTLPDPVLRSKARPDTRFDKNLLSLVDDMIETMRPAPGVGLAAPQVGISQRLIVIEYAEPPEEDEEAGSGPGPASAPGTASETLPARKPVKPKLYVIANPEIVKSSAELVAGVEGCLSIPGLVG